MARPVGTLNKSTVAAKDALAQAFKGLGGVKGLVKWAKANPDNLAVFYRYIWPKLIPLVSEQTVHGAPPSPHLSDPSVMRAALALDEAVDALSDANQPRPLHAPAAPLGEVSPRSTGELTEAVHEAAPAPVGQAVSEADDDDPAAAR